MSAPKPDGASRSELLQLLEKVPQLLKTLDLLELYSQDLNQKHVSSRRSIAASSVSSSFNKLEETLELDANHGRGLRSLIANGEADAFMVQLKAVLRSGEELVEEANLLRERRHILLSCYNPHIKAFVASGIQAFHQRQTTYRVLLPRDMGEMRRVIYTDIETDLLHGQCDYLVLTLPPGAPAHSQTESRTLCQYRFVVAAHPGHPFATQDVVTGQDLVDSDEQFLVGPQGFLSRTVLDKIFRSRSRSPRIKMENPDSNTRVALASNGYGIAIVHSDSVDPVYRNHLSTLKDSSIEPPGTAVVAWHKNRTTRGATIPKETHNLLVECLVTAADQFSQTVV